MQPQNTPKIARLHVEKLTDGTRVYNVVINNGNADIATLGALDRDSANAIITLINERCAWAEA